MRVINKEVNHNCIMFNNCLYNESDTLVIGSIVYDFRDCCFKYIENAKDIVCFSFIDPEEFTIFNLVQ